MHPSYAVHDGHNAPGRPRMLHTMLHARSSAGRKKRGKSGNGARSRAARTTRATHAREKMRKLIWTGLHGKRRVTRKIAERLGTQEAVHGPTQGAGPTRSPCNHQQGLPPPQGANDASPPPKIVSVWRCEALCHPINSWMWGSSCSATTVPNKCAHCWHHSHYMQPSLLTIRRHMARSDT